MFSNSTSNSTIIPNNYNEFTNILYIFVYIIIIIIVVCFVIFIHSLFCYNNYYRKDLYTEYLICRHINYYRNKKYYIEKDTVDF